MGIYGEVWARRNVYSAPPRYYKCTGTHGTPRGTHGGPLGVVQQIPKARYNTQGPRARPRAGPRCGHHGRARPMVATHLHQPPPQQLESRGAWRCKPIEWLRGKICLYPARWLFGRDSCCVVGTSFGRFGETRIDFIIMGEPHDLHAAHVNPTDYCSHDSLSD